MHEPRLKQTLGLHYSIHATGADHLTGVHSQSSLDGQSARTLYEGGCLRHLVNYIGVCKFVPWTQQQLVEAMEYITGWDMASRELIEAVERGVTLMRIFNIREGFTAKDDVLPRRFNTSPPDSPLKGIDPEQFIRSQRNYFQLMGWDEDGVPTKETLARLGIDWAS